MINNSEIVLPMSYLLFLSPIHRVLKWYYITCCITYKNNIVPRLELCFIVLVLVLAFLIFLKPCDWSCCTHDFEDVVVVSPEAFFKNSSKKWLSVRYQRHQPY